MKQKTKTTTNEMRNVAPADIRRGQVSDNTESRKYVRWSTCQSVMDEEYAVLKKMADL